VVVLVALFGVDRLPTIARSLGEVIREFRAASQPAVPTAQPDRAGGQQPGRAAACAGAVAPGRTRAQGEVHRRDR